MSRFCYVEQSLPQEDIEVLYDYELNHNRRPKVLVQTAGHVSGAVTYIQRADIKHDPWPPEKASIAEQ